MKEFSGLQENSGNIIRNNTKSVRDVKSPLLAMDRLSREKINKAMLELNNTL